VLGFYKTYRAVVRAKVASLAAADRGLSAAEREERRRAAMRSFHLAASYELPPALVLTCGLPGVGKTTAARAIAAPFEALVLRSDVRRKRLAGLAPGARAPAPFGEGIYAPELTERTYRALHEGAAAALREGRTTVVDATFGSAEQRAPFAELARSLGAALLVARVTVPEDVAVARLADRAGDPRDASDADVAVYRGLAERFEPPDELPGEQVVELDGTASLEEIAAVAIDALVGQARAATGLEPGR
jgi:predicted kinase